MLALGPSHVFHFYREPTDMRKGFDGLCGPVRSGMKRDPFLGDVFVFINRRRTYITFLVWDRSGWVLYYKRLESRTFELLETATPLWTELMMPLDGAHDALGRGAAFDGTLSTPVSGFRFISIFT